MENSLQWISKYKSALMGFAAWCILLFHEWQPLLGGVPVLGETEGFLKTIGFFGVDLFFFLSGLGLTYGIRKGSVGRFYWRRIKRLMIPALVMALLRLWTDGWSLATLLKNLSGYAFFTENIYAFLWFIPAVCTLYLLFPLYHKAMTRSGAPALFTAGVLLLWLVLTVFGHWRYDFYGFTNRIPVFLLGVLLGEQMQKEPRSLPKGAWIYGFLGLGAGLFLIHQVGIKGNFFLVPASNCFAPTLLLAVSSAFLLAMGLERVSTNPFGRAINRALSFFGGFSLEIYCVQEWLGEQLIPALTAKVPLFAVNLINLTLTMVAAFGLFWVQKYLWQWAEKAVKKCRPSL